MIDFKGFLFVLYVCSTVRSLYNTAPVSRLLDRVLYKACAIKSTTAFLARKQSDAVDELSEEGSVLSEPMFSISYDPFRGPTQQMLERDLEDLLMKRAMRFLDNNVVASNEVCYLVGLEDKSMSREASEKGDFTMEESLTELSELAGAAGLKVVGSTYQRVFKPSVEYYIGQGKTKDIQRSLTKLKCSCVVFDAELSPSQQKNLEIALNDKVNKNGKSNQKPVKVLDRTALILDIFAQHAKTKEGQLQVQLALLTYRLPRLTNMWTHLERQSASAKGRSNGGVGLRGPGEKQLESDKRQMQSKISALKRAIDSVRTHRSKHRHKRRQLGVPVVALVGYTNSGKSTLLNSFTHKVSQDGGGDNGCGVFVADMLFATLDPTTRMIRAPGLKNPDILLTDTVGFIQKLPTNVVAAFRATLEEITEADVLLHVADISNPSWRKQEAAVLTELSNMGLCDKPVITVWNKIDRVPETKEFFRYEAGKRQQTVALSASTGEGMDSLLRVLETALSSQMQELEWILPYEYNGPLLSTLHRLSILEEVKYGDDGILVRGHVPRFLCEQIVSLSKGEDTYCHMESNGVDDYDQMSTSGDGSIDLCGTLDDVELKRPVILELKPPAVAAYRASHRYDNDDANSDYACLEDADDESVDADVRDQSAAGVKLPLDVADIDWKGLAKGRHRAVQKHMADW